MTGTDKLIAELRIQAIIQKALDRGRLSPLGVRELAHEVMAIAVPAPSPLVNRAVPSRPFGRVSADAAVLRTSFNGLTLAASADTRPKGEDALAASFTSGAVPEGQTP